MKVPVQVEIVAYAPTAFYHCTHCEVFWREVGVTNKFHDEQVSASLPPDLAGDYQAISDWVRDLLRRYCDQVSVKVIDAASIEGFWKTARHGLRNYPAVLINGKKGSQGGDFRTAEVEIVRRLESQEAAKEK